MIKPRHAVPICVLAFALVASIVFYLRWIAESRYAALRSQSKSRLVQIGYAVRHYEDLLGTLSAANGDVRRISWRKEVNSHLPFTMPQTVDITATPAWLTLPNESPHSILTSFVMVQLEGEDCRWLIMEKPGPGVKWTEDDTFTSKDVIEWLNVVGESNEGIQFINCHGILGNLFIDKVELYHDLTQFDDRDLEDEVSSRSLLHYR